MSTGFTGVTFANQNATPSDDAIIRRAMLADGILNGCDFSYTGSTLTMTAGQLMICGRQIRHPAVHNWPVVDATTGFARVLLTIDLTRTSTKETFEQVDATLEYASSTDGFPSLLQTDINGTGTIYQSVLCVVSLGSGGISGIVYRMPPSAASIGGGGSSIIATAPTGSTVYIINQDEQRKDTAERNGVWTFANCAVGTWTVYASLGDDQAQDTVIIQEQGQLMRYEVTITYFEAIIQATYPVGSTCTCTKGDTVLEAPDTSGSAAFPVDGAGDWVVYCERGAYSDTQIVNITESGQSESIALTPKLMLYDGSLGEAGANGANVMAAITGGWTFKSLPLNSSTEGELPTYSYNADNVRMKLPVSKSTAACAWYPKNKIDLTDANTCNFMFGEGTQVDTAARLAVIKTFGTTLENSNVGVAKMVGRESNNKYKIPEGTIYSMDVSKLSGEYYPAAVPYGLTYDSRYTTYVIRKVWLE